MDGRCFCAFGFCNGQGVCAEDSAAKFSIGREAQDAFALASYAKTKSSHESGESRLTGREESEREREKK